MEIVNKSIYILLKSIINGFHSTTTNIYFNENFVMKTWHKMKFQPKIHTQMNWGNEKVPEEIDIHFSSRYKYQHFRRCFTRIHSKHFHRMLNNEFDFCQSSTISSYIFDPMIKISHDHFKNQSPWYFPFAFFLSFLLQTVSLSFPLFFNSLSNICHEHSWNNIFRAFQAQKHGICKFNFFTDKTKIKSHNFFHKNTQIITYRRGWKITWEKVNLDGI